MESIPLCVCLKNPARSNRSNFLGFPFFPSFIFQTPLSLIICVNASVQTKMPIDMPKFHEIPGTEKISEKRKILSDFL